MWRKIISMALMVAFLVTITGPVTGHDGVVVVPNQFDPGGDEHPWGGGEHSQYDPNSTIATVTSVPNLTNNFFIDYAITRSWTAFSNSVRGVFSTPKKDTEIRKTATTVRFQKEMRDR